MRRIAEVLLISLLNRYPIPMRLNLFNFFGQYSWLKNILDELRPELFPEKQKEPEAVAVDGVSVQEPDQQVLAILNAEVQGQQGYYLVSGYLGPRGSGHLFTATETTAKRAVTLKEYLLPKASFTQTQAFQRQENFKRLAGIQLADGRFEDFRVIQPLEAIVDTNSYERCFLVTDVRDRHPTLRQTLHNGGSFSPRQVQDMISQILQSLDFLHNQKYSFPSGAIQNGLIHGNLSLDSLVWTRQDGQLFVYLCDLLVWEQWFHSAFKDKQPTQSTPDLRRRDLQAVGEIGLTLLPELTANRTLVDPEFHHLLESLKKGRFDNAEAARQELLRLATQAPTLLTPPPAGVTQTAKERRLNPLWGLAFLALGAGAWAWFMQSRPSRVSSAPAPAPAVLTCCLAEVSAIPAGRFTYTGVRQGTWWMVLQQRNLLQPNSNLTDTLAIAQPKLDLQYLPAASVEASLALVRSGEADFAVMPLISGLPGDLMAQEIAYDGLAVVVAFSYAKRRDGLPTTLKGQMQLKQVQQLFEGTLERWKQAGGPDLEVERYISNNPEAIALFQKQVLSADTPRTLPNIRQLPAIQILRQIIRGFEVDNLGGLGITTISELWGQCAVYPLALSSARQAAVQPMIFRTGQDISPETNLCNRKGAYGPDPERFQTGQYPLSYPLMVIYPRDNRRSTIGRKFVELMRTVEGQRLLQAAGLVPLSRNLPPVPTTAKP